MKTMTRPEVQEQVVLTKSNKLQAYVQLAVNLAAMYAGNEISISIWRMMTGH